MTLKTTLMLAAVSLTLLTLVLPADVAAAPDNACDPSQIDTFVACVAGSTYGEVVAVCEREFKVCPL